MTNDITNHSLWTVRAAKDYQKAIEANGHKDDRLDPLIDAAHGVYLMAHGKTEDGIEKLKDAIYLQTGQLVE